MTFEEVKREALKLSREEKLELAYDLLRSLEEAGYEVDWEWATDAKTRREREPRGGRISQAPAP